MKSCNKNTHTQPSKLIILPVSLLNQLTEWMSGQLQRTVMLTIIKKKITTLNKL